MAHEYGVHGAHVHEHAEDCGHARVAHADHEDYLHDGHLHHPHEDHYDEHALDVTEENPVRCMMEECACGHKGGCEHPAIPHGDHVDHVVDGRLHRPHGEHCDDHGPVKLLA